MWSINGSIGDSWGFVLRNCTSFVSWRLHERNGMAGFDNHFRGEHWGNAANWDDVARRLGYRVDSVPAIGAVAQTDAGRVGHVAWVSDIGPGTVTIEEYNHGSAGGYGTRTVPVGDFRYLHLADVAPSPLVGSDRPVVSVPDGLGGSWTARVDDARDAAPDRPRPTDAGGRSPGGLHPGGGTRVEPRPPRPPLGGRHLARRPGHGRYDAPRAAGPARRRHLGPDREPGARPVAHPASGARDGLRGGHAGHPAPDPRRDGGPDPDRVGRPASWSTHSAPVLGNDATGSTWLVAVRSRGATYAQSLERGRLLRLRGPAASLTSTPALTTADDGTTRLHQVSAAGRLGVRTLDGRRWSRPTALAGEWSPYASPAVGEVAGGLHVAATDRTGAVVVTSAVPGRPSRRVGAGRDLTRSPGLVTRRGAELVVARTGVTPARPAGCSAGRGPPSRATRLPALTASPSTYDAAAPGGTTAPSVGVLRVSAPRRPRRSRSRCPRGR